jgi:hypothetical protein
MPLFDSSAPLSEEMAAMYRARTLLSQSTALQELFEADSEAEALALILPGPMDPPLAPDQETYTVDELEGRIGYAQIFPQPDENSIAVIRSRAVGAISEKTGIFQLHVRRQVRDAEYNAANGRRERWLYVTDRTSRILEQFIEAADLNLASSQIVRLAPPMYNPRADWPTQGRFLFVDFAISWGGSEQAE